MKIRGGGTNSVPEGLLKKLSTTTKTWDACLIYKMIIRRSFKCVQNVLRILYRLWENKSVFTKATQTLSSVFTLVFKGLGCRLFTCLRCWLFHLLPHLQSTALPGFCWLSPPHTHLHKRLCQAASHSPSLGSFTPPNDRFVKPYSRCYVPSAKAETTPCPNRHLTIRFPVVPTDDNHGEANVHFTLHLLLPRKRTTVLIH